MVHCTACALCVLQILREIYQWKKTLSTTAFCRYVLWSGVCLREEHAAGAVDTIQQGQGLATHTVWSLCFPASDVVIYNNLYVFGWANRSPGWVVSWWWGLQWDTMNTVSDLVIHCMLQYNGAIHWEVQQTWVSTEKFALKLRIIHYIGALHAAWNKSYLWVNIENLSVSFVFEQKTRGILSYHLVVRSWVGCRGLALPVVETAAQCEIWYNTTAIFSFISWICHECWTGMFVYPLKIWWSYETLFLYSLRMIGQKCLLFTWDLKVWESDVFSHWNMVQIPQSWDGEHSQYTQTPPGHADSCLG